MTRPPDDEVLHQPGKTWLEVPPNGHSCHTTASPSFPYPWSIARADADITALIPGKVERGGHVRAGPDDGPFDLRDTDVELLEEATGVIRSASGELASAEGTRQALD